MFKLALGYFNKALVGGGTLFLSPSCHRLIIALVYRSTLCWTGS